MTFERPNGTVVPARGPARAPLVIALTCAGLALSVVGAAAVRLMDEPPPVAAATAPPLTAPQIPTAADPAATAPEESTAPSEPAATVTVTVPRPAAPPPDSYVPAPHTYVLVLDSLAQRSYSLRAAERAAADLGPVVEVVDSTTTAGLKSGYWALVVPGFRSETDATWLCPDFDRNVGGTCYARYIG